MAGRWILRLNSSFSPRISLNMCKYSTICKNLKFKTLWSRAFQILVCQQRAQLGDLNPAELESNCCFSWDAKLVGVGFTCIKPQTPLLAGSEVTGGCMGRAVYYECWLRTRSTLMDRSHSVCHSAPSVSSSTPTYALHSDSSHQWWASIMYQLAFKVCSKTLHNIASMRIKKVVNSSSWFANLWRMTQLQLGDT